MIPLGDDNPLHPGERPYVNWLVIGLCVGVFFYQISLPPDVQQVVAFLYGAIPSYFTGHEATALPPEVLGQLHLDTIPPPAIPPTLSLFTSMFMHGGLMHLAGNMLYLWIFGDNVEVSMGHRRYAAFYLICGVLAALAHIATAPASPLPMVGASGAISGVLGAYVLLFPRANVRMFFAFGLWWRIFYVPAFVVLGMWFGLQLLEGMMSQGQSMGGVAVWAHVGGFIAGVVLVKFFVKPTQLFHAPQASPWTITRPGELPPPRRVIDTQDSIQGTRPRGPWDRS